MHDAVRYPTLVKQRPDRLRGLPTVTQIDVRRPVRSPLDVTDGQHPHTGTGRDPIVPLRQLGDVPDQVVAVAGTIGLRLGQKRVDDEPHRILLPCDSGTGQLRLWPSMLRQSPTSWPSPDCGIWPRRVWPTEQPPGPLSGCCEPSGTLLREERRRSLADQRANLLVALLHLAHQLLGKVGDLLRDLANVTATVVGGATRASPSRRSGRSSGCSASPPGGGGAPFGTPLPLRSSDTVVVGGDRAGPAPALFTDQCKCLGARLALSHKRVRAFKDLGPDGCSACHFHVLR